METSIITNKPPKLVNMTLHRLVTVNRSLNRDPSLNTILHTMLVIKSVQQSTLWVNTSQYSKFRFKRTLHRILGVIRRQHRSLSVQQSLKRVLSVHQSKRILVLQNWFGRTQVIFLRIATSAAYGDASANPVPPKHPIYATCAEKGIESKRAVLDAAVLLQNKQRVTPEKLYSQQWGQSEVAAPYSSIQCHK